MSEEGPEKRRAPVAPGLWFPVFDSTMLFRSVPISRDSGSVIV